MSEPDYEKGWIVPTEIPFDELKGFDLEECLYWLLDGMGAKDIEWRLGGSGAGAADGGRDIEARFYVPDTNGEIIAQRWWVECKGRSGTLERQAVVTACNNVVSDVEVACLVIATNTTFTNPTRDWVKKWQERFPFPRVLLWDRASLERILAEQPATVLRLFEGGLSSAGHLSAIRERFWNLLEYSSIERVKRIWIERNNLQIGVMERVSLIANEFAHGNIDARPWIGVCEPEEVFETFQYAMFNLVYIWSRMVKTGVDEVPLVRTLSYLMLATLRDYDPGLVLETIKVTLKTDSDEPMPEKAVKFFLMPIFGSLQTDLQLVCSGDCARFSRDDSLKRWDGQDPLFDYWSRFDTRGISPPKDDGDYYRLENTRKPCKVGFDVGQDDGCPLYQTRLKMGSLDEFLYVIARVVRARSPKRRTS